MPKNWKKVALLIIFAQLIALPILLIAAKNQQESRSNASEITESLPNTPLEGNSQLSTGRDFSSDPATEIKSIKTSAANLNSINENNPSLNKEVYAYLPYWEVDSETDTYLQYKYLTHLIYHGISLGKNGVINKSNGPWNTWTSPTVTNIVSNAHSKGAKVIPNIVLFNSSSSQNLNEFLDNPQAQTKAINQIVDFLNTSPQPVDGVAIDFEYPSTNQKDQLSSFIHNLRLKMNETNSNWDLIIAVDGYSYAGGGFDLPNLAKDVDSFFIMSYHLRNVSSASKAGSTNPYSALSNLADNFLAKVPANKIVLGFPLYLAEWKTEDDSLRADKVPNTGSGITVEPDCGIAGTTCTRLAQRYASTYGKKYDSRDKSAYYSFYVCTGTKKGWRQVYFDDEQAFTDKFGIVNEKNLRGVGFWAQNYDKGYLDTWKAIYNAFGNKSLVGSPTKKAGFIIPAPIQKNGCTPPSEITEPVSKTPTPASNIILKFAKIKLHGIGTGGDNANRNAVGNSNPLSKIKKLKIEIYDGKNNLISQSQGDITYSPTLGYYSGDISIPSSNLNGVYIIKIQADKYLKTQVPGIFNLTSGANIDILGDNLFLISGNSNNDNELSLLDYNIIIECYSDLLPAKNCSDEFKKLNADLNDDGKINQSDYNLFIREASTIRSN